MCTCARTDVQACRDGRGTISGKIRGKCTIYRVTYAHLYVHVRQARSVAIYRRAATAATVAANAAKRQTEKLGYSNKRRRYVYVKFTAVN